MKKIISTLACGLMIIMLTACGGGESEPPKKEFIEEDQIADMYTSPSSYIGKYITMKGKVFTEPETSGSTTVFQMWGDVEKSERNTVVVFSNEEFDLDVETDMYVEITGYVEGEFEGENAFGTTITAPQIRVESIQELSYIDAVSPTIEAIDVNEAKESNGVTVTLQKIEFAENETRVYLSVENQSSYDYSFYSFNSKIIQGDKQYTEETNFDAEYPEIETEISSGVKEEGIIAFPSMNIDSLKFICEGYSDNYELDQDTFTFEVEIESDSSAE